MAWEYLDNPEFQARFTLVKGILDKKLSNATVIDINCGYKAAFRDHIESMFEYYYGNDLRLTPTRSHNFELAQCDDTAIWPDVYGVYRRFGRIDVVMLLGDGGGYVRKELVESSTLLESFKSIVVGFAPQLVVHETVKRYEESYGVVTGVRNFMNGQNYNLVYDIEMNIKPDIGFVSNRIFSFFEKKEK